MDLICARVERARQPAPAGRPTQAISPGLHAQQEPQQRKLGKMRGFTHQAADKVHHAHFLRARYRRIVRVHNADDQVSQPIRDSGRQFPFLGGKDEDHHRRGNQQPPQQHTDPPPLQPLRLCGRGNAPFHHRQPTPPHPFSGLCRLLCPQYITRRRERQVVRQGRHFPHWTHFDHIRHII